jgi:GNAT superfamily N-acetyltransferase
MTVTIKQATRADAKLLAELGGEIFYKTFAAVNNPADMALYLEETFTEKKLLEEFDEPGANFFLAYADGTVAGYAKLGMKRMPDAIAGTPAMELERLYVHPLYQKQKIGYTLMAHCIQVVKDQGCKILWLGVWEHHPTAIRFYERVGFQKFGEHLFQLGNDAQTDWLMKLDII